jgi:serine O-acetyltransferase
LNDGGLAVNLIDPSGDGASRAGGAAAGLSLRGLLALMREDWETHDRHLSRPGLQVLLLQRFGAWRLGLRPGVPRKAASLVYRTLDRLSQNVYGIALYDTTRLGRRVKIPHHPGIVIGGDAVVGDGCLIRHNVTIGLVDGDSGAPRIGKGVELGVGAVVIGGITIGDGARIGPNAVVVSDIPAGATAFATPARRMQPPRDEASTAAEAPAGNP